MPNFTPEQYRTAIRKYELKSRWDYSSLDQAMFHCCFHSGDDTPSLSMNFKLGLYHCFACGESGRIDKFIRDKTGMTISQYIGLEKADMNKLVDKPKYEPFVKKIEDRPIDIRGILVPFNVSEEAKRYLKKRYIDEMVAVRMNMKYTKMAYVNGTYFERRLMIPIYNEYGNMINIEGRDVTFQQERKCLYPSKARKTVYEWYRLDKRNPLYLVEGLIKLAVLRGDKYFTNSSCTFGNMITDGQMEILKGFSHIVLIPDNDEGGRTWIRFFKEKLESLNTRVNVLRIVNLGNDIKDADEIPQKSGKTVEQFRVDGGFHMDSSLK